MACNDALGYDRETTRLKRLGPVFRRWHKQGKLDVRAINRAGVRVEVAPGDYLGFDITRGELIGDRWAVLFINVEVRKVESSAPALKRAEQRIALLREVFEAASPEEQAKMTTRQVRDRALARPEAAKLLYVGPRQLTRDFNKAKANAKTPT
jgi:hypothetical protein